MRHAPGDERPASEPIDDVECVDAECVDVGAPQAKEAAGRSDAAAISCAAAVAAPDTVEDAALSAAVTLNLMAHDILLAQDIVAIEQAQEILEHFPPKGTPVCRQKMTVGRRKGDKRKESGAHSILDGSEADSISGECALAAAPKAKPRPIAAIAERRTSDSVPIVLGSVLGALMLVVFSFAALFAKMAR